MPLYDFLRYSAGFMPASDVEAQKRCFSYLEQAIANLESAKDSGDAQNELKIMKSLHSLIEVASGSARYDRANTFWKYWDKNKNAVMSIVEGTDDNIALENKIGELEDGRYYAD